MIKMILATDEKGALGLDGKLPWNCPKDLSYFKEQTAGHTVVMGRNTYKSLPFENGLPDRRNIVLTRDAVGNTGWWVENTRFTNLDNLCYYTPCWIIGGKEIYEQTVNKATEIHHTIMAGGYEADTYLDLSFLKDWLCVEIKRLSERTVVKVYRRRDDNTISNIPYRK